MISRAGRAGLLVIGAVGFALAPADIGWWTVPLLASLLGIRLGAGAVGVAAGVGWAGLLARDAVTAPLLPYAGRLGGLFGLPGWSLVLLTVLFAGLLAWSAAALIDSLRRGGT
jgi:hypothetical protein